MRKATTKPKFKIGDVVRVGSEGGRVFEIYYVTDCKEMFNDSMHDWAYGAKGENPELHTFEKFLVKVTKLEKALK
jgi:hypothetical protein